MHHPDGHPLIRMFSNQANHAFGKRFTSDHTLIESVIGR